MAANTLTGNQLLVGLSTFIDDDFSSTTTSAGNSAGTTIVDTQLEKFGDNKLVGQYIRITGATAQYQVCRVTSNAQATGTVTVAPPFSAQIGSGIAYELHKYEPKNKFQALDSARFTVAEWVFKLVYDETITTDGRTREYSIPTTLRRGPALVFVEKCPNSATSIWNFLPSPQCDDTMANWAFSSATASSYNLEQSDLLIPKYGSACTKVAVAGSTNGTATLVVGSMINGVTAALAAGREMTYGHWVYCKTASRLTLKMLDDTGVTATSTAHQGKGWELLTVTDTISPTNANTLSVRLDVSSDTAAVVYWANNAWFYFGESGVLTSDYYHDVPIKVRRDASNQKFWTPGVLDGRLQLRLVGKELLSALGTTISTQATATMEVDEASAEILYAEAAELLFQLERVSTQNLGQVTERIKMARDRAQQLRTLWEYELPEQRILSPFMR